MIEIKQIEKDLAVDFVQKYHYSQIMPRLTKYYLGFYENDILCGVVTLGWGTQPLQTIKKIFYNDDLKTENYLEIGKMCFLPSKNNTRNFGSKVCSMLSKWLKQNTNCLFLYTLADGIMGKCGYVYQASNFVYIGKFKTSVYMDIKTGEKIHPRSAKQLCIENAVYENKSKVYWLTYDFCKYKGIDKINGLMFRYILPLSKDAKKILNKYDEYKNLSRPKDDYLIFEKRIANGKFERIPQPTFNMRVFNHNYQKGGITLNDKYEAVSLKSVKMPTMFDVLALKEKEPELFNDLVKDYPIEKGKYLYEVV